MHKSLLLVFLIIVGSLLQVQAQPWQATNLTSANFLAISAVESHDGELFAIVFNGIAGDLHRLNADKISWSPIVVDGIEGIPGFLRSSGERLYLGTTGLGFGMLYYSEDNGASFAPDTLGLPSDVPGKIATLFGLQYLGGRIIANHGPAGYWLRESAEAGWREIVTPTALNGGVDPIAYAGDSYFAFDNTGNFIFYASEGDLSSWTERSADLPENFTGSILEADQAGERLYVAGAKSDGSDYGVYYSDDGGFTWTGLDLSAFIGTDAKGGQQEVTSLYARGDRLFIALENDAADSPPNVVSTSTGFAELKDDSMGLPVDPGGVMQGASILEHQDYIVMSLNVRDVYIKKSGVTSVAAAEEKADFGLYPNPAGDFILLDVESVGRQLHVKVFGIDGSLLLAEAVESGAVRVDVSGLSQGLYVLQLVNEGHQIAGRTFIKR